MDKPHLYCTVWNIMVNMVSHKKYTLYMFPTYPQYERIWLTPCLQSYKKERKQRDKYNSNIPCEILNVANWKMLKFGDSS